HRKEGQEPQRSCPRRRQNVARTENCIVRASPASPVIVPTVVLFATSRLGRPKFARSVRLKTSQRSDTSRLPDPNTFFCRLMSTVIQPGPRRMLRPELPNVPDVTSWNAAGSNHLSTVGLSSVPSPIRFGRPVAKLPTLLLLCTTVNGRPVRVVRMPL